MNMGKKRTDIENANEDNKCVRFIDLFAGIGGIRLGFENAFNGRGIKTECVFTSEIKEHAIKVLTANHPNEIVNGDIREIKSDEIPDFDFLLGGFPCQAFSYAGLRKGFMDTRGTLFFEIERILRDKKPYGFILENVEGLVSHDKENKTDRIGKTLTTILTKLTELGYCVEWRLLNAKNFALPQDRKRIYIVGTRTGKIDLDSFPMQTAKLADILEKGKKTSDTQFVKLLLKHYSLSELQGKSIKDKRGGDDNIHSWDIELKGHVSSKQKMLLNKMATERRKKKWAEEYGIKWMDGMPLTLQQISSFFKAPNLLRMLEDLVKKGYLKKEHPKDLVEIDGVKLRKQRMDLPIGYNIVAGKLSFEISKVLPSDGIAPTMVAMDMKQNYVVDGNGIRKLTMREGLRLFGYPDSFSFPVSENEGYDLLGNTVAVPVIAAVANRLYENWIKFN